jgi:GNAT superfamily N-acetyltransferase
VNANDLYGLPLDRFVAERDGLAEELRRRGDREQATHVSGLRKPSVAAWAVNQLVRTQSRAVAELFEAGDALQAAQAQLVAGAGGGDALREARAREREGVNELGATARGLLSGDGHELSSATLERVAETLHAAALKTSVRDQVAGGCLVRELRHVGLGEVPLPEGAAHVKPGRGKPKPAPRRPAGAPGRPAGAPRRRAGEAPGDGGAGDAAAPAVAPAPKPSVRPATAEDAPAIARLLDAFNREFEEPTPGRRWLARRLPGLLALDTAVLLAGRGPDGLAVLRFRPALWSDGLECYLAELYVVPDKRGRGLGRALMKAVLETARRRGADRIELGTSEQDERARRLYESLGFINRERGPDGPVMFVYERPL